jgi:hypothetical protein
MRPAQTVLRTTPSISTCLFAIIFLRSASEHPLLAVLTFRKAYVVATLGYMHRQRLRVIRRSRLESVPTYSRKAVLKFRVRDFVQRERASIIELR